MNIVASNVHQFFRMYSVLTLVFNYGLFGVKIIGEKINMMNTKESQRANVYLFEK